MWSGGKSRRDHTLKLRVLVPLDSRRRRSTLVRYLTELTYYYSAFVKCLFCHNRICELLFQHNKVLSSYFSTIEMASNFVPGNQMRYLRACMVCSIVQTQSRFLRDGCPNCEAFLDLTNHPDSVQECTSQVFEGLITLADPAQSWVAKWQRLDGYVGGVYAVKVVGMLPDEVKQNVEDAGGRYIPRDGSADEQEA